MLLLILYREREVDEIKAFQETCSRVRQRFLKEWLSGHGKGVLTIFDVIFEAKHRTVLKLEKKDPCSQKDEPCRNRSPIWD